MKKHIPAILSGIIGLMILIETLGILPAIGISLTLFSLSAYLIIRYSLRLRRFTMREYVIKINKKFEKSAGQLTSYFGQSDEGATIRLGLALLKVVKEVRDKGNRVAVVDSNNNFVSKIIFPGD